MRDIPDPTDTQEAKEDADKTPLQCKLDEFGDTLTWIIGVICVAVSHGNTRLAWCPLIGARGFDQRGPPHLLSPAGETFAQCSTAPPTKQERASGTSTPQKQNGFLGYSPFRCAKFVVFYRRNQTIQTKRKKHKSSNARIRPRTHARTHANRCGASPSRGSTTPCSAPTGKERCTTPRWPWRSVWRPSPRACRRSSRSASGT